MDYRCGKPDSIPSEVSLGRWSRAGTCGVILIAITPTTRLQLLMPNPNPPETEPENSQSFAEMLSQHERSHSRKPEDGGKGLAGTVVSVTADSVLLDIGYKIEGLLPLADFQAAGETVAVGDKFTVSIKGRDPEGYYSLSRFQIAQNLWTHTFVRSSPAT